MYRLVPRCNVLCRETTSSSISNIIYRSLARISDPLTGVERQQECLQDATNDIISTSMAQTQSAPAVRTSIGSSTSLPILDSASSEMSSELLSSLQTKDETMDKTPLAFEEIPGPAILKLWEKYWKYVPLLGTQLFCSLLINGFTQGRLSWNRNITPLKYLFNEYGPIVRIHGPFTNSIVMIHRPEHIAEVLSQEGDTPIRSGIDILQHYRLHYRKYKLPGPFTMQSSEWIDTKSKLEKPLAQQLSLYFGKLEMTCDELAQRIRKIRNRQDEVPGNFDLDLSRWSMECFSILVFNKRLGFLEPTGLNADSEPARIVDALVKAHTYLSRCETGFQVWRFFETPFSKRLFEACDIIDGMIGKYIRQAQNTIRSRSTTIYDDKNLNLNIEEDSPILEKLLLNERMNPDDVSTLLMDMIILGVQATTNCEAFLLYYLAKNPRIQKKLYEETCSILPSRGSTLTEGTLKNMPYLKACFQECLRLRPAFPYITRLLPKTITLHGYTIPEGTYLIMANEISSQREENFEDAEKFKPERWMTNKTEEDINQEYSCLPFGHGVRSCLGRNMAETEMMLLTAKLVKEFKIEYDYADIRKKFMMMNVPNRPLRFRFIDRD